MATGLVFSTHVPCYAGPAVQANSLAMKSTLFQPQIPVLRSYQNVYLRKIKITPILSYGSTLMLRFQKNNIPFTYTQADSSISAAQLKIVLDNSVDTSALVVSGPG